MLQEFGEKTQGVWGKDPRRLGKGSGSINVMIDKKNKCLYIRSKCGSKKQQQQQEAAAWIVRGERAERRRERKSNEPSVPQQRAIIV